MGPYIETSEGKYYAGNDVKYLGAELIKPFKISTKFGGGEDFNRYLKLRIEPYRTLSITKDIPTTKIPPTEEDYKKGWYRRYFMKRINHNQAYKEIDKDTYRALKEESKSFDYRLYEVGSIKWWVVGNTEPLNNINIERHKKMFPFLKGLFSAPNEFQKIDELLQQSTQTFTYIYPEENSGGGGGGY